MTGRDHEDRTADAGTLTDADADAAAARLVRAWLLGWAAEVHEHRSWLTDLDAAIGDGDHGINLDRGLAVVATELAVPGDADAGTLLSLAGRRLMGVVGGASGALYGRALLRAGEAVTLAKPDRDGLGVVALGAAVDAIAGLGKALPRDKTMLDALGPALAAFRDPGDLDPGTRHERAAAAAESGADATVPLVARKGRASYLGERSAGHRDPGAASAAFLVRCLARAHASA